MALEPHNVNSVGAYSLGLPCLADHIQQVLRIDVLSVKTTAGVLPLRISCVTHMNGVAFRRFLASMVTLLASLGLPTIRNPNLSLRTSLLIS